MAFDSFLRFRPGMLALAAVFIGCAATSDPSEDDVEELEAGGEQSPIIGGSKASAYPEAALIDMGYGNQIQSACSGTLIAPRVVLTAGHCIGQFTDWYVTLPFSGNQKTHGKGKVLDYNSNASTVDPSSHDVGLIVLDKALSLQSYPAIGTSKLVDGTKIQNIGRINNGTLSSSALYISKPIAIKDAKSSGFPFDYITQEVIEHGDSGGPVVANGTHTVVAVNSGAGGGTEVLARTDLVLSWIKQVVNANGGGLNTVDPNGGGGGGAGGGDSGGGDGGDVPSGNSEAEPNNSYQQTNAINGQLAGQLTSSDEDWFTWEVGSTPVKYNITVKGGGNAEVQMWKLVNGTYHKTPNTSPTQIAQTSNGAGKYFLAVFSANGSAQSYTLSLQK